jgi:hypothetical protein
MLRETIPVAGSAWNDALMSRCIEVVRPCNINSFSGGRVERIRETHLDDAIISSAVFSGTIGFLIAP